MDALFMLRQAQHERIIRFSMNGLSKPNGIVIFSGEKKAGMIFSESASFNNDFNLILNRDPHPVDSIKHLKDPSQSGSGLGDLIGKGLLLLIELSSQSSLGYGIDNQR